ncbi:rho GTPase-activating protein 19 isoform X2 [Lingula anatina]|uniref:Rho GTPase-activating protein 19 isoform X2 n=1 Tax=Lingula anatina TaxID=7574 RepID=A0A1S3J014_LINAN|nr:rho GTPase-activating protein 19 isoform X2 [Lingula anatina]|eukprot:XP_013403144.1 rho GTPase-activating protein 19 isoform X2 [Lingula anatina]
MSKSSLKRRELDAEALVHQLKTEDTDQFNALIKMHLSFMVDMPTLDDLFEKSEENKIKKGHTPFLKRKNKTGSSSSYTDLSSCNSGIIELIDFISEPDNIALEGIFRKAGNCTRQKELKEKLTQGCTLDLDSSPYNAHDCACVLKWFLGELPEPLLMERLYAAYCQVPDMIREGMDQVTIDNIVVPKQIKTVQLLFLLLPVENATLLRKLLTMLHQVASVEENKMTAENLGAMFAPHLLCPKKMTGIGLQQAAQNLSNTVSFMIQHSPQLFMVPKDLVHDIDIYYRERQRLGQDSEDDLDHRRTSPDSDDAVKTTVTYVDRVKSKELGAASDTEVALAQLYAHVQNMPDSTKKRKLLKQFNKANGMGTPHDENKHRRSKSVGQSIKDTFMYASKKLRASTDNLLSLVSSDESGQHSRSFTPEAMLMQGRYKKKHLLKMHKRRGSSHDTHFNSGALSLPRETSNPVTYPVLETPPRTIVPRVSVTPINSPNTPVMKLFNEELTLAVKQHAKGSSSPAVHVVDLKEEVDSSHLPRKRRNSKTNLTNITNTPSDQAAGLCSSTSEYPPRKRHSPSTPQKEQLSHFVSPLTRSSKKMSRQTQPIRKRSRTSSAPLLDEWNLAANSTDDARVQTTDGCPTVTWII